MENLWAVDLQRFNKGFVKKIFFLATYIVADIFKK